MNVCEVHTNEILRMPNIDEFEIPRLLAGKGFKHTGGPLIPKLSGTISMTFDNRSHTYKFKQTGSTDKVNDYE